MLNIKIFGDSHTVYFQKKPILNKRFLSNNIAYINSECYVYKAASVKGFGSRNSTLNVRDQILLKIKDDDLVVLSFGQVDIELGIYYKKIVLNENETYKSFFQACIDSYILLINLIKEKSKNIVIKGLNLPVLLDENQAAKYVSRIITENIINGSQKENATRSLRRNLPNIFERINITNTFNSLLQEMASREQLLYFDINKMIAYPNGIVKEEFLPSSFDHHLADNVKTRMVYFNELENIIIKNGLQSYHKK